MKILSLRSWLRRAQASRTAAWSGRSVSRRVLCVEDLEGRMLLNADATGFRSDLHVGAGSAKAHAAIEWSYADKSAVKTAGEQTAKSPVAFLQFADRQLSGRADDLEDREDRVGREGREGRDNMDRARGESRFGNQAAATQRALQSLWEVRGQEKNGTGESSRAETIRAVVALFSEIGRSIELHAGGANAKWGFAKILGGELSGGTVKVFGAFLPAGGSGGVLTPGASTVTSGDPLADSGVSIPSSTPGSPSTPGAPGGGSGPVVPGGEGESNTVSEPYILTFDAWDGGYEVWVLEGTVDYEDPALLTVVFDGVITGSTGVDSDGTFSYSTTVPQGTSGTVTAQAYDPDGISSNVVYDWIA